MLSAQKSKQKKTFLTLRTFAPSCFTRPLRYLCASVLICGSFTSLAHADWTLTDANLKQTPKITINTWSPSEGLSYSVDNAALAKADSRSIVTLQSDRQLAPAQGKYTLLLRNGDSLDGAPVGISGQSLQYAVAEIGTILVPIKSIASLTSKDAKPAPAVDAPDKDIVRLKNGDEIGGLLVAADAEKIQIATNINDSATTDIELKNIDRISFGGVAPTRSIPPLSARITFATGSVLTVPLADKDKPFRWSVGDVTFADPAGKERKASADQINAIEVLGGRVVFLTDLDPASDKQSSFLGTKWPTQLNANVLGQPLKVNKTIYPRGLGVHTRSALTYELDGPGGGFEVLSLRAALDDSSAPHGEANLSILLDGKVLWESKNVKPGQLSPELKLTVKGGKTLELRADPATKLDVLGRVNWLAPALTRP